MIVERGQRTSSRWRSTDSRTVRTLVVGTSRCTENCAVAVCSSRSASVRVMPTSRAISASEAVVSSVIRSTRRWVKES